MTQRQIHDPYGFTAGSALTQAVIDDFQSDETVERGLRQVLSIEKGIPLKKVAAGCRHQLSLLLNKKIITPAQAEEYDDRIVRAWRKMEAELQ